jgi:hypothetical protein
MHRAFCTKNGRKWQLIRKATKSSVLETKSALGPTCEMAGSRVCWGEVFGGVLIPETSSEAKRARPFATGCGKADALEFSKTRRIGHVTRERQPNKKKAYIELGA